MVINPTLNEVNTPMDESPLNPGWMTANEIEAEWDVKEANLRYHVNHNHLHREALAFGAKGKATVYVYKRADVEELAIRQGWKRKGKGRE